MGGRWKGSEAMRNFGSKYLNDFLVFKLELKKMEENNGDKMGLQKYLY